MTGDTAKGVDILADLFIDTRDNNYIYNQGRCFEQNRRYEDAIGRFREYLLKGTNLSADEKADAQKHIDICQSYLGKPATDEGSPTNPPIAVPGPVATPISPTVGDSLTAREQASRPQGRPGAGLRITGVVVASVGVAALVTGVVLNLKVNSMTSDLEKTNNYDRSTDSTRKDYKSLGWIGYGVGAAGIVAGGVLCYLGWRKSNGASSSLALVPMPIPGGAGSMLTGAF